MATTTNFGWATPDNTALVKDGASAIRSLGSAIDTSMMDLKGGTAGQVLKKNTNTDMDFVWGNQVNPLYAANIASGTLTGTGTLTISLGAFQSNTLYVWIEGASPSAASATVSFRINSYSGANDYGYVSNILAAPTTYAAGSLTSTSTASNTSAIIGKFSSDAASVMNGCIRFDGANAATGILPFESTTAVTQGTGNSGELQLVSGRAAKSTDRGPITSISIIVSSGTFDAGIVRILGDQG